MAGKSCPEQETQNYQRYVKELLSTISLGDILRLSNLVTALCDLIPPEKELVEETVLLIETMDDRLAEFRTDNPCPRCGQPLYLSDLPQYNEVCYECEENF